MFVSGGASIGAPMANYAAARRVGDFVFMSGVVAVDPARRQAVAGYDDLPEAARIALRALGYDTGQMSVDVYEAPAVAQSWFVLERIRQLAEEPGGGMGDVVKLVQYFRDLRHYPAYNRVRGLFYPGRAAGQHGGRGGALPARRCAADRGRGDGLPALSAAAPPRVAPGGGAHSRGRGAGAMPAGSVAAATRKTCASGSLSTACHWP